ncbi:DUF3310 domain-containing protein [Acetobacter pasteurianus]|uniref:DUF3310 domain-containing protein n=1 Tax=Acetobacter pasteurianus subsp. pasteurianus TaxID=481145 RepID=A0A1Y0XYW3_ACEPA|nr:DUF3310 domain-containing protein [Acetobacter pasteurianus]ARW48098.1 hypothetical protein S1001342_01775 [Acetobacter pasteurianus subsp. pasteurianus]
MTDARIEAAARVLEGMFHFSGIYSAKDVASKMLEGIDKIETKQHDPINHPSHYTTHPSGIECIQITEHMGFNLGNAIKYIWRADLKGNALEDLEKAAWYIQRELQKRRSIAAEGGGNG